MNKHSIELGLSVNRAMNNWLSISLPDRIVQIARDPNCMHISKRFANQERLCATDTGPATHLLQLQLKITNEALAF